MPNRKVVKHVREVNNFLRKQVLSGKDLSDEKDRNSVIKTFLESYTTTTGKMTPELFAFFLQKINTHALFEQLDNENYSIVFPTYVPFDVEAVASVHGFPSLYTRIEANLRERASKMGGTKTASAATHELGGLDYLDKVASANSSCTDPRRLGILRDEAEVTKLAEADILKVRARELWWKFSNLDDFTKTSMFQANRAYKPLMESIRNSRIMGGKDKKATLSDFNRFVGILDDIIASDK